MLGYAWRLITRRRALWFPTTVLAALAGLPGLLAATFFAAPVTALLLAGDPLAAVDLLPGPLSEAAASGIVAWVGVGVGALALLAIWTRIYVVALWLSREGDASLREAFGATRSRWGPAYLVYLEGLVAIGVVVGAVLFLMILTPEAAGGSFGVFFSIGTVVAIRSVIRIVMSLSLRACTLGGEPHLDAWRTGVSILRERRSESIAAWMTLMAAGVGIWIGGRLISPVLQDTLFAFPSDSGYGYAREILHLVYSVPLEAFLLSLSFGVWTAVYLGGDALREEPRTDVRAGSDPWVIKGLATLVVLVLIANGGATLIDGRYRGSLAAQNRRLAAKEIEPEGRVENDNHRSVRLNELHRRRAARRRSAGMDHPDRLHERYR